MKKLNLPIGAVTVGLEFENIELFNCFQDYFMMENSSLHPDIQIAIQFTGRGRYSEVPNSLFLTKKVKSRSFIAGDGLIKGKYNPRKARWQFKIDELLIEGDYKRVFEQILYQAYNSGSIGQKAFLVHSCGVIKDGEGYLFVGPPEAGKSTVAALSREYQVINDEINIVDMGSDHVYLMGTPFNGLFRDKKNGRALLKGIFLLNQAAFHDVEQISGGKPIKALTKEIIPPIGLEEELSPDTYIKMMDIARTITEQVPIYRMDFLPDRGFWDVIGKL